MTKTNVTEISDNFQEMKVNWKFLSKWPLVWNQISYKFMIALSSKMERRGINREFLDLLLFGEDKTSLFSYSPQTGWRNRFSSFQGFTVFVVVYTRTIQCIQCFGKVFAPSWFIYLFFIFITCKWLRSSNTF